MTESGHSAASESVEAALEHLGSQTEVKVEPTRITLGPGEEGLSPHTRLVGQGSPGPTEREVCRLLDSMIEAGSPPDLVLDLTRGGDASQMMKIVSSSLSLPTITSGQGEEGDLWGWRSLSSDQKDYLVQVRSPSDLLPYVIKDLALATHIKTALVLYDDTFSEIIFISSH